MNLEIFVLWIMVWIIFVVLSIIETRGITFGFLSGLWILFLGVYLYIDGLQIQTGVTLTASGATQNMEYVYADTIPSFSTYGMLWGLPFILLGIYILYLASTRMSNK